MGAGDQAQEIQSPLILTLEAAKALELIKPCLDPASYPGSSLLEVRIK